MTRLSPPASRLPPGGPERSGEQVLTEDDVMRAVLLRCRRRLSPHQSRGNGHLESVALRWAASGPPGAQWAGLSPKVLTGEPQNRTATGGEARPKECRMEAFWIAPSQETRCQLAACCPCCSPSRS